nr:MAG TPA: hypothetical protein [Caudoviricetes sp.]
MEWEMVQPGSVSMSLDGFWGIGRILLILLNLHSRKKHVCFLKGIYKGGWGKVVRSKSRPMGKKPCFMRAFRTFPGQFSGRVFFLTSFMAFVFCILAFDG